MTIPLIDLTDALTADASGREQVADQIRVAAETCGFFYISNHGVPQALIDRQFEEAERFFKRPKEAKQAVALQSHGPMRGYEAIGSQTLDSAAHADLKESFQCGREYAADHPYVLKGYSSYGANVWPSDIPEFQKACECYFDAMTRLSGTLMQLLARSLDLPEDYFGRLNACPSDTLRLLWYPPHPARSDARTFGAGAHTDWGALTILAQDANGGLEVQMQDGRWAPADPIHGTFVINLGDMIPRLTHGRYRSNLHRVINKNAEARHRQSVVFFTDLDFEALIEPIAGLAAAQHDQTDRAPFTVGEHMAQKVRETYG
ncbi:isopenicillin N synthase family dioxygenase [Sphingobium boeckii]|uniref:2-oxoglutarate-dependent ethylene/succinate-forming enzyme n=1 Tax=Sphingobium boeckii TaxID=1082345 RepID=A0A7W9AHA9_9SPHN|nr:isopenicillin N synthase family oxygenase [Sphingobium boeckii]MBB5685675.1 isopenicillin N synthase-like dioxygenase [Sphingobium boeckii]